MNNLYTDNKNQQILIALLKAHGVRKVIASPGGTNPAFLMSLQMDDFFEMYSCVDERSAAYMACGLAEETGEPVIICCTGATASRNYMSALTEAFYRKIPIITITCSRPNYVRGHLMPQVTNRSVYPADILIYGDTIQVIKTQDDVWDCEFKINKGLLALKHRGGGPIHFNVETIVQSCTTKKLPSVHVINRITSYDVFPALVFKRIAIFIGSHKRMSFELVRLIDNFCEQYNAVVFCDHTSGYHGKYSIPFSLIGTQHNHTFGLECMDLLIHIGEISGDYLTVDKLQANHVWRVNEDGEIRIRFQQLDYIFEMPVNVFFSQYVMGNEHEINLTYWEECNAVYQLLYNSIRDLPLSLISIAHLLAPQMPKGSAVHFSIINALRAWNFFRVDHSITTNCNVGGFGIDGCTSSLIGASLADSNKLYYLFTGDLAFFYDLNSLGNRHISPNIRILLLNDGKGAEFTHFMWKEYQGDRELYIAGGGHFGTQSPTLIRNFSEDLGFEYFQATTQEEFLNHYMQFLDPKMRDKPMLFEIITTTEGQSEAWKMLCNLAIPTLKERIDKVIYKYEDKIKTSIKNNIMRHINSI